MAVQAEAVMAEPEPAVSEELAEEARKWTEPPRPPSERRQEQPRPVGSVRFDYD